MSKSIIICGQTGTGKTSLALSLAKTLQTHLISADSRQIYKEMDIGTGKVDPKDSLIQKENIWHLNDIPIYGLNLITPDQVYSAGEFAQYCKPIIDNIISLKKTPILVGGTGFYIKSVIAPDQTISIPLNNTLRARYEPLEKDLDLVELRKIMQNELRA
ncbi:MAG: AAA family ATPase, partial [bacterium]|nr:AAA family ATPase [bacterium]